MGRFLTNSGNSPWAQGEAVRRVILKQNPPPEQLVDGCELAAQILGELRRQRLAGKRS
jgi:hypothetical protein